MNTTTIHDDIDEWAALALTDGLSAAEQLTFSAHLAACPQCHALYQKTQAMNQILSTTFDLERPAPNFEHNLVRAFRQKARKPWLAQIPATIAWVLRLRGVQTAGVLAALTLLVTVGSHLTGGRGRVDRGLAMNEVSVSGGGLILDGKNSENRHGLGERDLGLLKGASDYNGTTTATGGSVTEEAESLRAPDVEPMFDDKKTVRQATPISDDASQVDQLASAKRDRGERAKVGQDGVGGVASLAQRRITNGENVTILKPDGLFFDKFALNAPAAAPGQVQVPVDPAPNPGLVDARKLIRNANVELEVASFDTALDKLGTAATQAGGYVATKNSAKGGNGKLRGTIVIKVLPQNLDGFLLELRTVGEVKNQTLGTQDVTKEYTDTASRLRNAQRMEERLLKMLDEAKGKMSEILAVEKELGRVRESIETMQGELKMYDSLVAYATVTISLYEKDLNQPAAFLLRQTGNLELLAADVEKTYAEARRIAESVQAQIGDANISRDANGRVSATMQLIIPAPDSERTIRQLKELGRIANFTSETQRIAQNGSDAAGSSNAKVENAPAVFRVTIQHDEQTHRQIRFTVFAKDLDPAFDAAKKAATDAGAEIVSSNLVRPRNNTGNATLVLRVPAQKHVDLVATLQKLGRASDYQVQRDATNDEDAPVLISLSLTDEEPSVQQTRLSLQATDIEKRVQDFKLAAQAAGATVRDSSFQRQPDGRETAQILLRFPLTKYSDLLNQAQSLGKTLQLSVERRDTAAGQTTDNTAPAELSITLATETKIVADDTGLFATLRHTLSQAISSLFWSVQMIGVAVAFLAPWVVGLGAAWWITARIRRAKKQPSTKSETSGSDAD